MDLTAFIIGVIVLALLVCGLHAHLVTEINKLHTAFVAQPTVSAAIADVKAAVSKVDAKADVLVDKAKNALTGAALDAAKQDAAAVMDKLRTLIEGTDTTASNATVVVPTAATTQTGTAASTA